jgi:hypothetical protein
MDDLQYNLHDLIHKTMYENLWRLWPAIKRSVTSQVWDTIVNRYPSNFNPPALNLQLFVDQKAKTIVYQHNELQQR